MAVQCLLSAGTGAISIVSTRVRDKFSKSFYTRREFDDEEPVLYYTKVAAELYYVAKISL